MKFLAILFLSLGTYYQVFSQNQDIALLRKINLGGNESLDPTFRAVTKSVTPLILVVPAWLITTWLIRRDEKTKTTTILVCSSLLISGVATTGLKYGVNRKRPFDTYSDIEKEASGGSPSFPSGHTSSAFSLATSLSIACPKWYVIAPSFAWASVVGYSRMDLGVHYPSDVLAGAILGSGSAYLAYRLNKWYFKRKKNSSLKTDYER